MPPRNAATIDAPLSTRPAEPSDLPVVIALDAEITGIVKEQYWKEQYDWYGRSRLDRFFIIAEYGDTPVGFVVGEIRAWEFGSRPSGWIFAVNVKPDARLRGVASLLVDTICACFRLAGVSTVRTMVRKDQTLLTSFFRSQGMRAGPFIELEKSL